MPDDMTFKLGEYVDAIRHYEKFRENSEYLLDGVVIAFPHKYRSILGENKHDPEWSIAIKPVSKTNCRK